jgi:hypothetical protein
MHTHTGCRHERRQVLLNTHMHMHAYMYVYTQVGNVKDTKFCLMHTYIHTYTHKYMYTHRLET